jgi:crotonobetainyl-CoA:carnitine CoA-transferase CaiB-like acyl-CoA transferase
MDKESAISDPSDSILATYPKMRNPNESLLNGYRALDLTDDKGLFCGKILGDLGVDVIKIEKPGGDHSRNRSPFYHDIPHSEKSLYWWALNTSKRGITLNLESATGRELFFMLAKTSDFVTESFSPGYMDSLGLGYKVLSEINPRIIMTSITPFGQTGPYRDYKTSDLIAMALGGFVFTTGDSDRAPVRITAPQAYFYAGGYAALGTLIAHYYREVTGEGQFVDVSVHESVMFASLPSRIVWDFAKLIIRREGGKRKVAAGPRVRTVWRCKDGHVVFTLMGGPSMGNRVASLIEWMDSEGMAGDLKDVDWASVDMVKLPQEQNDKWEQIWADFFAMHTKAELYSESIKRGFMLIPVNSVADIAEDRQLAFRNYFFQLEHPELNTSITYPGLPFKSNKLTLKINCRAPLIGEHNEEIYEKELGLSKTEVAALKSANII